MPHPHYHPEYLEAHAQRLRDAGADDTAIGLEQCARSWRADQVAVERLCAENTELQARITDVQRRLQVPA